MDFIQGLKKRLNTKKGVSEIVSVLIIILLVVASAGIIWVIVMSLMNSSSESINLNRRCADVEIEFRSISRLSENYKLVLRRTSVGEEINGVKVIFYTEGGSSEFSPEAFKDWGSLELRTGFINTNLDDIQRIEWFPYFISESGEELICPNPFEKVINFQIPSETSTELSITSTPVTEINEGSLYSYQIIVEGGTPPYSYQLTEWPNWLSINSETGLINGTAPFVDSDNNSLVKVRVNDSLNNEDSQDYTLTVKNSDSLEFVPINDCEGLIGIREDLAGSYKLVGDIDCGSITNFNPLPEFKGILEGDNFYIRNLVIPSWNLGTENGLFVKLNSTGVIKNLKIKDLKIVTEEQINQLGGLVGINQGSIINVSLFGEVSSKGYSVGGLVGINQGIILSSNFKGTVKGSNYVGGLVGQNSLFINNSYVNNSENINITGNNFVGGLVGQNTNGGEMTNCYSRTTISSSDGGNLLGGLVGQNEPGANISNSYSVSQIFGENLNYVGGLVGENNGQIENSFWYSGRAGTDKYPDVCFYGWLPTYEKCRSILEEGALWSYFYDVDNPPMNKWDFLNIWSRTNIYQNFPNLLWEETV
ncbi:Ig domain-containing protein [Patescibacteria group bacterium]|nr:Ig domain-containing protein [Patescibacteria group bacterium]